MRKALIILGLFSVPTNATVTNISSDTPSFSSGGPGDVVNTLPGAGGAFWKIYGGAHLNHSNGSISFLDLNDSADADISSNVSFINSYDHTYINVFSGSNISFVNASGNSSVKMFDGSVGYFNMDGGTNLYITGFNSISYINLYNGAHASVTGYELSYNADQLTGRGVSGQPFNIWVRDFACGLGGWCPTGNTPVGLTLNNLGVWPGGSGEQPSGVPEPSVWTLMIAGFSLVGMAMRKRQAMVSAA